MVFSFFGGARAANNDADDDNSSISEGAQTPVEDTQPYAPPMTQAELIDAHFAKLEEKEAEAKLRAPRKLDFNPNITPDDQAWKDFRETIIAELSRGSVGDTVKEQFECDKGQNLYVLPPEQGGIREEIQARNAKDYQASLAPGGRFHDQPDNIVTKLTMLKFGLPIAPLTYRNIQNAANCPDQTDPPDGPDNSPPVQRIYYAEQPLEFLDVYNERSYGWKIIRRKNPSIHKGRYERSSGSSTRADNHRDAGGDAGLPDEDSEEDFEVDEELEEESEEEEPEEEEVFVGAETESRMNISGHVLPFKFSAHQQPACMIRYQRPVQPVGNLGNPIRGGAGTSNPSSDHESTGYIYSHTGGRAPVGVDKNSFVENSLRLLGIDRDSDWSFLVDQYSNREDRTKRQSWRNIWNKGASSYLVTKEDQSLWEESIMSRVMNLENHWMMAVRPNNNNPAPATLSFSIIDKLGKPQANNSSNQYPQSGGEQAGAGSEIDYSEDEDSEDGDSHKGNNSAAEDDQAGVGGNTDHFVKAYTRDRYEVSLENYSTFAHAVRELLGLSEVSEWNFSVDCYERAPGETRGTISDTFSLAHESSADDFHNHVTIPTQDKSKDWYFIARLVDDIPEAYLETFEPARPIRKGRVCGYSGQLFTTSHPNSILEATHSILALEDTRSFSFEVDCSLEKPNVKPVSFKVSHDNWSTCFQNQISPLLVEHGWSIFVRRTGFPKPSGIQPRDSIDIIRLEYEEKGIAYWKIPKDMEPGYGVNQPQQDFFRAMRLFFRTNARPSANVLVGGVDIGFGGMHVTDELWKQIKYDIKKEISRGETTELEDSTTKNTPRGLQYKVELQNHAPDLESIISIRFVGRPEFGCAPEGDFQKMMDEIIGITEIVVANKRYPENFRIWKRQNVRELRELGHVLRYRNTEVEVLALQEWYRKYPGPTQCVQFRPDWNVFDLSELEPRDSDITWQWDATADFTLASFANSVRNHYKGNLDPMNTSIEIREPQTGTRYVLSSTTTEEEWRTHVFDWFTTPNLRVNLIKDMKYSLDTTTQWGIPFAVDTSRHPTSATPSKIPAAVHHFPIRFDRYNKDRTNIANTVGRHFPLEWNLWMEGQEGLEKTQHNTYYAPQPIVEPGKAPDAPVFAESRELPIMVGDHTPTAYASVLTPTDVRHLQKSRRRLRNQVLERETSCAICMTSYRSYETKDIEKHTRTHQRAINSAGDCVLCGDRNWRFWSTKQKQEHLYDHQARHETTISKNFWTGLECPGCDEDLSKLGDMNQVLNHVISHDPQTVKYCDRCSRPYRMASAKELAHHTRVCIDSEVRESAKVPRFCRGCGINTTDWKEKEHAGHKCPNEGYENSCPMDGMDLTVLDPLHRLRHQTDCRIPGGPHKTFCGRCGTNVAELMGDLLLAHSQGCKSAVYTQPAILKHAKEKFDEFEALRLSNATKDAKRRKANFLFRQRERDLAAREAKLRSMEIATGKSRPQSNVVEVEPEEFSRLKQENSNLKGEINALKNNNLDYENTLLRRDILTLRKTISELQQPVKQGKEPEDVDSGELREKVANLEKQILALESLNFALTARFVSLRSGGMNDHFQAAFNVLRIANETLDIAARKDHTSQNQHDEKLRVGIEALQKSARALLARAAGDDPLSAATSNFLAQIGSLIEKLINYQLGQNRENASPVQQPLTLECPLIVDKAGALVACGHVMSLTNGGAEFSAHLGHRTDSTDVASGSVVLGPNAIRFRNERTNLETRSQTAAQSAQAAMEGTNTNIASTNNPHRHSTWLNAGLGTNKATTSNTAGTKPASRKPVGTIAEMLGQRNHDITVNLLRVENMALGDSLGDTDTRALGLPNQWLAFRDNSASIAPEKLIRLLQMWEHAYRGHQKVLDDIESLTTELETKHSLRRPPLSIAEFGRPQKDGKEPDELDDVLKTIILFNDKVARAMDLEYDYWNPVMRGLSYIKNVQSKYTVFAAVSVLENLYKRHKSLLNKCHELKEMAKHNQFPMLEKVKYKHDTGLDLASESDFDFEIKKKRSNSRYWSSVVIPFGDTKEDRKISEKEQAEMEIQETFDTPRAYELERARKRKAANDARAASAKSRLENEAMAERDENTSGGVELPNYLPGGDAETSFDNDSDNGTDDSAVDAGDPRYERDGVDPHDLDFGPDADGEDSNPDISYSDDWESDEAAEKEAAKKAELAKLIAEKKANQAKAKAKAKADNKATAKVEGERSTAGGKKPAVGKKQGKTTRPPPPNTDDEKEDKDNSDKSDRDGYDEKPTPMKPNKGKQPASGKTPTASKMKPAIKDGRTEDAEYEDKDEDPKQRTKPKPKAPKAKQPAVAKKLATKGGKAPPAPPSDDDEEDENSKSKPKKGKKATATTRRKSTAAGKKTAPKGGNVAALGEDEDQGPQIETGDREYTEDIHTESVIDDQDETSDDGPYGYKAKKVGESSKNSKGGKTVTFASKASAGERNKKRKKRTASDDEEQDVPVTVKKQKFMAGRTPTGRTPKVSEGSSTGPDATPGMSTRTTRATSRGQGTPVPAPALQEAKITKKPKRKPRSSSNPARDFLNMLAYEVDEPPKKGGSSGRGRGRGRGRGKGTK